MDQEIYINGLKGLGDFGDLSAVVRRAAMGVGLRTPTVPLSNKAVVSRVSRALGASAKDAAAVTRLTQLPPIPFLNPKDVLTPEGANAIGAAGKLAQEAAKLHAKQAKMMEQAIDRLKSEAKRAKDPKTKAGLIADAAQLGRELLTVRVKADRAAIVAGGALAALQFRKEAESTTDSAKKRDLLGKAAAALDVTQKTVSTPVKFTLPEALTDDAIQKLKVAAGREPASKFNAGVVPPKIEYRPAGGAPRQGAMNGLGGMCVDLRGLDGLWRTPVLAVNGLGGVDGLGALNGAQQMNGLGGLFDSLKDIAKSIIPAKTVVGKFLNGDVGGAVASGIQWVGEKVAPKPPAPPPPLPEAQQEVLQRITHGINQVTPPGMASPANPPSNSAAGGGFTLSPTVMIAGGAVVIATLLAVLL